MDKLSGGKSLNEKVVSWHLLKIVLGWAAGALLLPSIFLKISRNALF